MPVRLIMGSSEKDYPVNYIGGKASGLFKLKGLENRLSTLHGYTFKGGVSVPSFFVIPVGYNLSYLDTLLCYADRLETNDFAIRSSSPYEDGVEHSFDGVFDSHLSVKRSELVEAIEAVHASSLGEKARQYSRDFGVGIDDKMAVIVQRMVYGSEQGIIYSKFPASIEVSKILSWNRGDEIGKELITLIRRSLMEDGTPCTFGDKVLEGQGLEEIKSEELCTASYAIEKEFKHPVRVEYHIDENNEGLGLYLLQARAIAGIHDPRLISMPELTVDLLVGTTQVNGKGDYTLPVVIIYSPNGEENLPYNQVEELDQKFSEGYILFCQYLRFWLDNYDCVTPHKKAVVAGSDLGRSHDLDIARKKGLLYLGTDSFGWKVTSGEISIKTGDVLRVVSDGVRGYLYRPK